MLQNEEKSKRFLREKVYTLVSYPTQICRYIHSLCPICQGKEKNLIGRYTTNRIYLHWSGRSEEVAVFHTGKMQWEVQNCSKNSRMHLTKIGEKGSDRIN